MTLEQSKKDKNLISIPEVSDDFIKTNKLFWKRPSSKNKKGGPYNKAEREKRRNKVYKLYFDYGYNAKQISKILGVNRNTINRDIDYISSKTFESATSNYPEIFLDEYLERIEIQRTRSRETLDKTSNFKEKQTIERFINFLDNQKMNTRLRAANFSNRAEQVAVKKINDHMESTNQPNRLVSNYERWIVSEKARQTIDKIIEQDEKTLGKN